MRRLAIAFACVLLAGCKGGGGLGGGQTGCLSQDGQQVVLELIVDAVEDHIDSQIGPDGSGLTTRANIRAAVASVNMALSDVRTAREDPDSTMRFCAASLVASVPQEMLDEADAAAELISAPSMSRLAETYGFERSANGFSISVEYAVQPTDDGDGIYGEIQTPDAVTSFLGEVVVGYLMRARIESEQAHERHQQEEEQRLEAEAVAAESREALVQAQADYDLARQAVNAAWAMLDPADQAWLTASQTAFNRTKTATCNLEAARASTEATSREATRLACEARITNERVVEIERYVRSNY